MTGAAQSHPYELIPLDVAGYILGAALLVGHLVALIGREGISAFLVKSPRNEFLAQITLGAACFWFFLLVAPPNMGILSELSVSLAEFEGMRWVLVLLCPAFLILMILHVKELLFPRALGFLGLLTVAPFLAAAYLKDPETRLLIPIWCYAVIVLSLVWVGKPYIYRNMVNWITASASRWNALCVGGMLYGAAILICAIFWW